MSIVNESMCDGNNIDMFVTCLIGILDETTGELKFTSAGHNPPVIIHEGQAAFLSIKKGMVLGDFERSCYTEESFNFTGGDSMLLYTDGVTEANDIKLELYGDERLLAF